MSGPQPPPYRPRRRAPAELAVGACLQVLRRCPPPPPPPLPLPPPPFRPSPSSPLPHHSHPTSLSSASHVAAAAPSLLSRRRATSVLALASARASQTLWTRWRRR